MDTRKKNIYIYFENYVLETSRCVVRGQYYIVSYSTLIESNGIHNVKLVHIFNKWIAKLQLCLPNISHESPSATKPNKLMYKDTSLSLYLSSNASKAHLSTRKTSNDLLACVTCCISCIYYFIIQDIQIFCCI